MYTIPVSTGELLDKMSILEIKLKRLSGDRRADCLLEYKSIAIEIFGADLRYYYLLLKQINEELWNIQADLHLGLGDPVRDYPSILVLNDRRFKVKQKINRLTHSTLNEQKGYDTRKCVVYGYLGMGDMYWMNGAVRFLSTVYDEVVVVCKTKNVLNTEAIYADDPSIKIWPIPCDVDIQDITQHLSQHVMIACGIPAKRTLNNYPDDFYIHMGLSPKVREQYFHHAHSYESDILAQSITEPYRIVHESKSGQFFPIMKQLDIEEMLTLNIAYNPYPLGHRYYKIAQRFVQRQLGYYISALENATELHLVESSLSCLAHHLDLSQIKVAKIYAASEYVLQLDIFKEGVLCM